MITKETLPELIKEEIEARLQLSQCKKDELVGKNSIKHLQELAVTYELSNLLECVSKMIEDTEEL